MSVLLLMQAFAAGICATAGAPRTVSLVAIPLEIQIAHGELGALITFVDAASDTVELRIRPGFGAITGIEVTIRGDDAFHCRAHHGHAPTPGVQITFPTANLSFMNRSHLVGREIEIVVDLDVSEAQAPLESLKVEKRELFRRELVGKYRVTKLIGSHGVELARSPNKRLQRPGDE